MVDTVSLRIPSKTLHFAMRKADAIIVKASEIVVFQHGRYLDAKIQFVKLCVNMITVLAMLFQYIQAEFNQAKNKMELFLIHSRKKLICGLNHLSDFGCQVTARKSYLIQDPTQQSEVFLFQLEDTHYL